jgi:HAD superfamily hydrolase (TIGR01509 family)
MNSATSPIAAPLPAWHAIDTVLLDMDGTLLDLKFDNFFWQEWVPVKYAERHGLSLEKALADLRPRFEAHRGLLAWYCTDFWSRELDLPIASLKHDAREKIGWLGDAEGFLIRLRRLGKRMLLVTNAHTDTLRIKDLKTGLARYFDATVSSHVLGAPKEHPGFWEKLQASHPFDAARTLFVDDSLPVLRAARGYGIAHIVRITHPDSSQQPHACNEFAAVDRIEQLLG